MKKQNPYDLLRKLHNKPEHWMPQWADHLSVVHDGVGTIYLAEPYQLYPEAFRDFAAIEAHGWRVQVDGQSKHYPGRTVRVRMTMPRTEGGSRG